MQQPSRLGWYLYEKGISLPSYWARQNDCFVPLINKWLSRFSSRVTLDDAPELSQPALIAGVHPVSYSEGACILERFTFRCEVATFKPYCYQVVSQRIRPARWYGRSCEFNGIIHDSKRNDRWFNVPTNDFNYDLSAATIKLLIN